jgi:hypothetical protein
MLHVVGKANFVVLAIRIGKGHCLSQITQRTCRITANRDYRCMRLSYADGSRYQAGKDQFRVHFVPAV